MSEDIGIFLADAIQSEDSSLTDVGARMIEHRYELWTEISSKVGCDDVGHAIQGDGNIGGSRVEVLIT